MSSRAALREEAALLLEGEPASAIEARVAAYAERAYAEMSDPEDRLVARLIHRHVRGRRVLDLGCGPVPHITSRFLPEAERVVAVDVLPENLAFARAALRSPPLRSREAEAFERRLLGRAPRRPRVRLMQGDVRDRLPLRGFDAAMQIGCFACVDSADEFRLAVSHVARYLRPGAPFLMVNWVQPREDARRGVDCRVLVRPAMAEAGFDVEEHHDVSAPSAGSRRLGYARIVWALGRRRSQPPRS